MIDKHDIIALYEQCVTVNARIVYLHGEQVGITDAFFG